MEVRRVLNQAGGTLREFYASYTTGPGSRAEAIGRRMLALLDRLAEADGPPLWGLTSHAALHLWADADGPAALVHGHGPGFVVEPEGAGGGPAADADGAAALVLAVLGLAGGQHTRSAPDAAPGTSSES